MKCREDVGDYVRVTLGRGRHHHRLAVEQLPPVLAGLKKDGEFRLGHGAARQHGRTLSLRDTPHPGHRLSV